MDKPNSDLESCMEGMIKGNTVTTLRSEECQDIIKTMINNSLPDLLRKYLTTDFIETKVKGYLTSEDGKLYLEALIQEILVVRIKDAVTNEQVEPLLQHLTPKVLDQVLTSTQFSEHVAKIANDTIGTSESTQLLPQINKDRDLTMGSMEDQETSVPPSASTDEQTHDPQCLAKDSMKESAKKPMHTEQTAAEQTVNALGAAREPGHSSQADEPMVTPKKSIGNSLFGPLLKSSEEGKVPTNDGEGSGDEVSTPKNASQTPKVSSQGISKGTKSATSKGKSTLSNMASQAEPSEKMGTKTAMKRKIGDGDSATGEDAPTPKKTRIRKPPPGHATGADIKFSNKAAPKLSGAKKPCGKPRLIDTDNFAQDTNMANSNMQDVVATILWNHDPESIKILLENDRPRYHYVMYNGEDHQKNFAVYKVKVDAGAEIHIGKVDLSDLSDSKKAIKWQERVTYSVSPDNKWAAKSFEVRDAKGDTAETIDHKTSVAVKAMEMGRSYLLDRVWVDKESYGERVLLS